MKGIILAGGFGTRLAPLTDITNKHLLAIYDKQMILYPLQTLIDAGITEVMIVTNAEHVHLFHQLLGQGELYGVEITYGIQNLKGKGIPNAIQVAEPWSGNDNIAVILGDNIIEDNLKEAVISFEQEKKIGKIFLKEVPDPERFGIAEIKKKKIISLEEKPKKAKSNYAVTGIYFYSPQVWVFIRGLKLSERGEYEITDVNRMMLHDGTLDHSFLKGVWIDAGTPDSILEAAEWSQSSKI